MKISADPVRDYLAAVEREASVLPADRRQELLADLAEHIEVARAERPDVAVGDVLMELGDPRTIAQTALAESGGGAAAWGAAGEPARRGKVHPLVPLLMITLSLPVAVLFSDAPAFQLLAFLLRVTGAVLLCTSVHWTAVRKTTGVLLAAVLPSAAIVTWNLSAGAGVGDAPAVLPNLVAFALMAGTSVWLWRARRV
ncbi:hypothetical protein H9Y04_19735 [Streptomyces sp. TRM66268-LWL]|uniref:DUF1700 domain-containing protein n=1 Tax=Streptomyces polyasparticus TaxID=2767826 RepID=A0ABR7SH20_9ACTN|nr:hypothetical protein [Streptomyces polyasparticus]MBC9714787.1 hypothetical protein [Streptomyces polyasparticus]